jgi:hypothetical protein
MTALRLVILLLFAVGADLHAPVMPGAAEVLEESEESLHRQRLRRPRTLQMASGSVRPVITETVRLPITVVRAPRLVAARPVLRKVPPPSSDSSSAPEDQG